MAVNAKIKARKGQRPLSPTELRDKYAGYLNYCDDNSLKPTWEGFAEFIDSTATALLGWLNNKAEDGSTLDPEMSEAVQKINDSIVNRLLQRTDSMATFLVKQPRYGGYNDKPASAGGEPVKVEFSIRGMDSECEDKG